MWSMSKQCRETVQWGFTESVWNHKISTNLSACMLFNIFYINKQQQVLEHIIFNTIWTRYHFLRDEVSFGAWVTRSNLPDLVIWVGTASCAHPRTFIVMVSMIWKEGKVVATLSLRSWGVLGVSVRFIPCLWRQKCSSQGFKTRLEWIYADLCLLTSY